MNSADAGELKKKLDFAADLLASFCLNASSIDLQILSEVHQVIDHLNEISDELSEGGGDGDGIERSELPSRIRVAMEEILRRND